MEGNEEGRRMVVSDLMDSIFKFGSVLLFVFMLVFDIIVGELSF